MKTYLLTAFLTLVIFHSLLARIVNGYEKDVDKAQLSITHLRQLIAENPQFTRKHVRVLNARLRELTDLLVYHQLTDTLLYKFREIAPDLYAEIDTLKDHLNRNVDVYVRFVPAHKSKIESYGTTSFSISSDDQQMCVSVHGRGTVSVTVWIMNSSLVVLSHEFGHLKYMIPNLTNYIRYYNQSYVVGYNIGSNGHRCDDAGGRHAMRYETRYRQRYQRYIRKDGKGQIFPFLYMTNARKGFQSNP